MVLISLLTPIVFRSKLLSDMGLECLATKFATCFPSLLHQSSTRNGWRRRHGASDDILIIPVSVQSIILPDKNLSVLSFLQFSLPSASITTAPPLCKYFSTNSPPEDGLYLNYLHTQPLPWLVVLRKLLEGVQHAILGGSRSIIYAHADIEQPFPFWILMFWRQAYTLLDIQSNWRQAEAFLTKHQPNPVASTFHFALSGLCWSGSMKGFCDWSPIHDLANFASQKWLTDTNLNMMLDVMYADEDVALKHSFETAYFIPLLLLAHDEHAEKAYLTSWDAKALVSLVILTRTIGP
ncbi:hypothetical protein EDB19DRAFT_2040571 [Suillus lakei]|nr:hypothetical protein EDB19DRAFT_2040571 [Suillus lakei]